MTALEENIIEIPADREKKSYKQIIKSTSVMGGSTIITILMRIIRTKVLALLLGPAGIAIIGIFDNITSLASTIAGLGIETSGVRQIAEANGTGDEKKIARTIISLRYTAIISGLSGLLLLVLASYPVALLTFGKADHTLDIALLSITVLLTAVTGGQTALIQGMRKIKDLAKLSIFGAVWGTVLGIPIVYFFRERGIVLFMICVSVMSLAYSWWYARKIKVPYLKMRFPETLQTIKPLLRLGLVFMSAGLLNMGSLYLIRVLVIRYLSLDAAGMYQAAAVLSALYVGFILDAMARDYYPRLTALSGNDKEFVSLVNNQMETGLLIAIPGVLATMTLSQVIITVFYSDKFLPACDILRWQLLGDVLRIFIWPMAYMMIAKGHGKIFFWTELIGRASHIGFVLLGIFIFGLPGTGMAFFGMYVFYGVMIFIIARKSYGFRISPKSIEIGIVTGVAVTTVFVIPFVMPEMPSMIVNAAITILSSVYSIRALIRIIGVQAIYDFISKIKSKLGIKRK